MAPAHLPLLFAPFACSAVSLLLDFATPQPQPVAPAKPPTPVPPADLRARLLATPGLSDADRAQLNDLFDRQQQYGLVWEDKPEQLEETLAQHLPVLAEDAGRRLSAADPAAPQHTLIEGDNLHALTVLNYTHAGLVDVIYIDPPYNTGNRDFIYNDRFVDREDSYRHSKWLSFMAKRLKLARKLLKDTGVIFISIDDNEQAQLKMLCDEIFGEENFVATVIWQKNFAPKNSAKFFSESHEYVLCYAKSTEYFKINNFHRTDEQMKGYKNPDNDPRGVWTSGDLTARNYYSLGTYPITTPSGRVVSGPPKGTYWRFSYESFKRLVDENRIWFGSDGGGVPRIKRFLSEVQEGVTPQTIWLHTEAGNTQEAKKEIISVFGDDEGFFSTPKPLKLMQRILQLSTDKSALILDFFAGSGTTLHATMALNAEDGGTRRCILVTNNENNICEQVTYERNRRVIQGYTTPKGVPVSGLAHNSLYYYRTALVEKGRRVEQKRELVRRATELLCFKDSCHHPATPAPAHAALRLFQDQAAAPTRYLLMVYDEAAIGAAVALLDALLPAEGAATPAPVRAFLYVFADGHDPYTDDFEPVAGRGAELCAVPEALLQAYHKARTTSRAGRTVYGQ